MVETRLSAAQHRATPVKLQDMAARGKKLMTAQTVTFVGATLIRLLQDEEFRRRLGDASTGVRSWAARRKAQLSSPSSASGAPSGLRSKFGSGALARRIAGLREMAVALGPENPDLAVHIATTSDDLQRALSVAVNMPPSTKWRALRAIDARLDEIEKALIDAVLPR
jgi:hypothetical protein